MYQESNVEMIQYNSAIGVWGATIFCILITLIIVYCYKTKQISASAALIYAWSSQTFGLLFIGPTFNSFLFIQYFLILLFISRKISRIPNTYLYILLLPILSSIFMFVYTNSLNDFFFYHGRSKVWFYLRPFYYYVKSYLPLFITGYVILKDKKSTIDDFWETVVTITKCSCIIAIIQLIISQTINNIDLNELIGLKRRYIDVYDNSLLSVRVQAFMPEPKDLGCFLCLAIPILIRKKRFVLVIVSFFIALLTQSQTFIVLLFISLIIFNLPNYRYSIQKYIITTIFIIIGLFQIVSSSKTYFIEHYQDYKDNVVFELLAKRAISRYSDFADILDVSEMEFAGMPMQREVEMPIIKFFTDYPFLWVTGIGLGNATYIDPKYYEGTTAYIDRINGDGAPQIAMRWFNYIVNFSLPIAIYIFLKLTQIKSTSPFTNKYYAFLWVCLFFAVIDVWVVIFYGLMLKESDENAIVKTP